MSTIIRRYDIDWLRVITIGLLLIYHITIVFQPWGVFIGFIQSDTSLELLWTPMSMLNIWRIPLLFFVSGMGVCFAIKKKKLETTIDGENQKNFLTVSIWNIFYCSYPPIHLAKILYAGYYIFSR